MLNAFNIERLALELKSGVASILNKRLVDAFTTDKFEIYLVFESLVVKTIFFNGEAFFQFPATDKLQKKNRLTIFTNLIGQKVSEVIIHPYDRIFRIRFTNQNELGFILFGRFSQISQYQGKQIVAKFPIKSKDFVYSNFEVKDTTQLVSSLNPKKLWYEQLRFLTNEQNAFLANLIVASNDIEGITSAIEQLRIEALMAPLYLNKKEEKYELSYCQLENNIASFNNVTEALDQFARLYIAHQVFKQTKLAHLVKLNKELTAAKRKLKSLKTSEKNLVKAGSYKEIADLLMANLYNISKGEKEVSLLDFSGERQVKIKLKSELTPQANAERYYKKAKNEGKQLEYLLKSIEQAEIEIRQKEIELVDFESLEDFKTIKRTSEETKNKVEIRLPYKQIMVDGFEVRIGKGARDNDELLRQYSAKNDIWLHAKDVSGSHVIIRNPAKKQVPLGTIEKVAEIAAFNSKARTDTLAAVIYTDRKFVRKPKRANPGAVIVEKEEVILVEPKNYSTS